MAQSFNKTILMGRLTKDPELKATTSGKRVCSFTLAVDKPGKDAGANFIDCESWEQTAEFVGKYLKKGALVFIEGRLDQQTWEKDGQKRSAIRVVVSMAQAIGKKEQNDNIPTQKEFENIESTPQESFLDNVPF